MPRRSGRPADAVSGRTSRQAQGHGPDAQRGQQGAEGRHQKKAGSDKRVTPAHVSTHPAAVDRRAWRGIHTATLPPLDFLRRFLDHVLPAGFVKIRHCGLLASGNVATRLVRARSLLAAGSGEADPRVADPSPSDDYRQPAAGAYRHRSAVWPRCHHPTVSRTSDGHATSCRRAPSSGKCLHYYFMVDRSRSWRRGTVIRRGSSPHRRHPRSLPASPSEPPRVTAP